MDLQSILSKLFANAHAVGIEGVFQFVFGQDRAFWSEVRDSSRTGAGRHSAPDVTIEVAERDFLGIMGGTANVEELFASARLKISGNMGLATLLPQIISNARRGVPATKVSMNQRYPTPARLSERVSAAQPVQREVARVARADMPLARFQGEYLAHGTPVVISDALQDWPLFTMGREASLEHFAELQGITRHGDYVKKTFSTDRDFRSTSMADFIASLDTPAKPGETPAYMGNNIVPEAAEADSLPALLRPREVHCAAHLDRSQGHTDAIAPRRHRQPVRTGMGAKVVHPCRAAPSPGPGYLVDQPQGRPGRLRLQPRRPGLPALPGGARGAVPARGAAGR